MGTARTAATATKTTTSQRTAKLSSATGGLVAAAFFAGGILVSSVPMWSFVLIGVLVGAVSLYALNRGRR